MHAGSRQCAGHQQRAAASRSFPQHMFLSEILHIDPPVRFSFFLTDY